MRERRRVSGAIGCAQWGAQSVVAMGLLTENVPGVCRGLKGRDDPVSCQ